MWARYVKYVSKCQEGLFLGQTSLKKVLGHVYVPLDYKEAFICLKFPNIANVVNDNFLQENAKLGQVVTNIGKSIRIDGMHI